jgi:hypothetical protein
VLDIAEAQRHLCRSVKEFGQYLPVVLDVLQASDMLRTQVCSRYAVLEAVSGRLEGLPSIVARRGGDEGLRSESRILSVDDELQVAVLDCGSEDGVRPGMVWHVLHDGKTLAKLRVVEVRPTLCAVTLETGQLRYLAPGLVVRKR